MNKQQYENKREGLLAKAQELIDGGKISEGQQVVNEINQLDTDFQAAATAQANLKALQNPTPVGMPFANDGIVFQGSTAQGGATVGNALGGEEYRNAFMLNVLENEPIPKKFLNANQTTKTSDVGTVIPTTIMQKIIEKIETAGNILALVTRTSYQGGLSIPTSSVKPVAVWVAEGKGSDTQKKGTASLVFGMHKLRCAISMTLETKTTTLEFFEKVFVQNVVDAMTKALEGAIISGDGNGKLKGISLKSGQVVEIKKTAQPSYKTLTEAEGNVPTAYESGTYWIMSKKTFMVFAGMTDDNGQPIARINYGIGGKPERSLLGREVQLTEHLPDYSDDVTEDTMFAFLFRMEDYVLNTNLGITIKQYEDNETDDQVVKAVMLVDGQVVDDASLVKIVKKSA